MDPSRTAVKTCSHIRISAARRAVDAPPGSAGCWLLLKGCSEAKGRTGTIAQRLSALILLAKVNVAMRESVWTIRVVTGFKSDSIAPGFVPPSRCLPGIDTDFRGAGCRCF